MINLKRALKKIPGIRFLAGFTRKRIIDAKAILSFLQERGQKRPHGPIKVGFLCQYTPSWAKLEPLYQRMRQDPRFEPYLLCVPSNIIANQLTFTDSLYNDTYEYFLSQGYSEAINTLTAAGQWLSLKDMFLSYVFYTRPYDSFMPEPYTSGCVSRHSRVCLVLYGIAFAEEDLAIALNREFLSNTYFFFADSDVSAKRNIHNNRLAHSLKFQKTCNLGMPMTEALISKRNSTSPSWSFSKNDFRIIWTPRWTTDPTLGGTNFFSYNQHFLDFLRTHSDVDLLLRPHPLAFKHFVESGKMTPQQVEEYKACCKALPNMSIDCESEYSTTLWGSSVMVSDISGIMPEYFITGKPLIFCASNMQLSLLEHIEKMLEGCYIVYNEQELFSCLLELKTGNDPLLQKRQALIQELFGDPEASPSAMILDALVHDQ